MSEKENKCHDEHCGCHEHEHSHEHNHSHEDGCSCEHEHTQEESKQVVFKLVTGAILFVLGYICEELLSTPEFVPLILFGISYILVGFDIIKEAIENIIHGEIFDENFLMTVASLGAFAIKAYSEGCAVMLLFTLGEFLQSKAVSKSRNSIKDMLEKKSEFVLVEKNGEEIEIAPEEVKIDDVIIVKPGEKIDLDGEIIEGFGEVDMAALTGESIPASLSVGSKALAGSVNIDGTLKIRVEKEYKDSTTSRIIEMLENARDKKSVAEQFITRFAKIYTPIVCLIALLIIVVPPLTFDKGNWSAWVYNGLSALVVSCPCAIVISVPLGFFSGLGACSKEGILVKGSNYLEELTKCEVGVFDKTGTITSGKFEFVTCECFDCHCNDKKEHRELLGIIAAVEKYSNHPIAKSICLAFGQFGDHLKVSDAKNYAGKGVSAVVDGVKYYVGNDKLLQEIGVDFKETSLIGTPIYCATDDKFLGDIVFADVIKQDSKDAIAKMKKMGISKTIMLTGDKDEIAKNISKKAGLDGYYSKLLPEEKVEKLVAIKNEGKKVLYTGDGINDAPVLATADVGIAMGGVGSDVAIEASDMVIMGDSLSKIPTAIKIAKKTIRIIKENIVFSLLVKLVIIVLAAFGHSEMWLSVFGDVGVCLIAVANSFRAFRK